MDTTSRREKSSLILRGNLAQDLPRLVACQPFVHVQIQELGSHLPMGLPGFALALLLGVPPSLAVRDGTEKFETELGLDDTGAARFLKNCSRICAEE